MVFGGLHTTVALAQAPVWHGLMRPYMGTWAAGTEIARNGQNPNFVFRVSANDDYADKFLTRYATEVLFLFRGLRPYAIGLDVLLFCQARQRGVAAEVGGDTDATCNRRPGNKAKRGAHP